MTKPVLFARLHYNQHSGAGHVFRSLAIIECALRDGWQVIVVTDQALSIAPLNFPNLSWHTIDEQNANEYSDAHACLTLCGSMMAQVNLVWVDHYHLSSRWESVFQPDTIVVAIDDLCREHAPKTLVVDYSPAKNATQYNRPSEQCLLGLRYLLLRQSFRSPIASQNANMRGDILLQFGGSDRQLFDIPVLKALHSDKRITGEITWLQGSLDQLAFWTRSELTVHVVEQCGDMAALYRGHKVAIGASGVAMWERVSVDLPALVWQVADNQTDNFQESKHWPTIYPQLKLPKEDSDNWLELLNKLLVPGMSSSSSIDEFGANRVWQAIVPSRFQLSAQLVFQPFDHDSIQTLFELQCLPNVRRFSRNPLPPSEQEHIAWSMKLLNSLTEKGWLILAPTQTAIGWLKLGNASRNGFREISLVVDPEYQSMGVGREILDFAKREGRKVSGHVLSENSASNKLFIKSGFVKQDEWFYWPDTEFDI